MTGSAAEPALSEAQVCTCGAWDDRDLAHAPDCGTYDIPPGGDSRCR